MNKHASARDSMIKESQRVDNRHEKTFVIRSISLPVQKCLSMPWKDCMRLLHQCWQHSTCLANWASHQLRLHDVSRTPGMMELPPMQAVDLYALAFGRAREGKPRLEGRAPLPIVQPQYDGGEFWAGAKITAASLLRAVERKYRQERGKIVWRRERRTPEFLYPYPFPVHQQAWSCWITEDARQQPVIACSLPGGRIHLRLRNGPEFATQISVFKQIVEGKVAQQEMKLCLQRSHTNGTNGSHYRQGGGGPNASRLNKVSYRVMVRISYRKEAAALRDGIAIEAKTGSDPFLTLCNPGVRNFVLHCPWVQHWIAAHRRFLDRFADDLKFEKRWPRARRQRFQKAQTERCEKHARRLKSWRQMTAASVVGWALRQGASRILWDDTDRSFAEELPWFLLRECVQNKCEETGLVFVPFASEEEMNLENLVEGGESV